LLTPLTQLFLFGGARLVKKMIKVPVIQTFEEVWNKESWLYRLMTNKDTARGWYVAGWASSTEYINKMIKDIRKGS